MKIITNREYAIASTDVRDINNKEMRQMHELNNRIKDVLDSHNTEKKKYISDDDLLLMRAILTVFTMDYSSTQTSAFDNVLEELKNGGDKDDLQPEIDPDEDLPYIR